MIYCAFEGRIGNNLFQLAACISLAKHHKTQAVAGVAGNLRYIRENFLLNDIEFIDNGDLSGFEYRNRLPEWIRGTYLETKYQYNQNFFDISDNTFLDGFFQSEKYFKWIENDIRKNFTFKQNIIDDVNSKYNLNYTKNNSGFIHIRRCDYLQDNNVAAYPAPSLIDYYYNCILDSNIEFIYVFSDDINWCKENITGKITQTSDIKYLTETRTNKKFIFVNDSNPYNCLYMMSQLDVAIIANSTFSWWGAWLNLNKNKKVYYPVNWFGEFVYKKTHNSSTEYTQDLICPEWIGK